MRRVVAVVAVALFETQCLVSFEDFPVDDASAGDASASGGSGGGGGVGGFSGSGGSAGGCAADGLANSCDQATLLTDMAVDQASVSVTHNLVPDGDYDWYLVKFEPSASCGYGPTIQLVNAPNAALHVFTSCAGASGTGSVTCTEGSSDTLANMTMWQYTNSANCADHGSIDPTPNPGGWVGSYLNAPFNSTLALYVQVYATSTTTTCLRYTLRIDN